MQIETPERAPGFLTRRSSWGNLIVQLTLTKQHPSLIVHGHVCRTGLGGGGNWLAQRWRHCCGWRTRALTGQQITFPVGEGAQLRRASLQKDLPPPILRYRPDEFSGRRRLRDACAPAPV